MAALASSAVTLNKDWRSGGTGTKKILHRNLTLVLTGQGGGTNTIGAAALGFNTFIGCTNAFGSIIGGSLIYPAAVNAAGSVIQLADLTQAVDASRATGADITDTVTITVWGY